MRLKRHSILAADRSAKALHGHTCRRDRRAGRIRRGTGELARRSIVAIAWIAAASIAVPALAAPPPAQPAAASPPAEPAPVPMEFRHFGNFNLARLTGDYAPLRLHWQLNESLHDVQGVFPHPLLPARVYLATGDGLLRSNDSGKTFAPLAAATADKIGLVTSIAFQPDAPERLYIATHGHGIFVSDDGGQTLAPLATQATGLASDMVQSVFVSPEDKMLRTLIAIHGVDASGLSRSSDGGKTWQILFPEQHVLQAFWITRGGKDMLLECSPDKDVDSRTLYYLSSLQEPWQKLMDDVIVTGAASPPRSHDQTIFLSTADKGLFRIARQAGIFKSIGPADELEWSSLGITRGANADSPVFYAFHPKKFGMVMFTADELIGPEATGEPATQPAPAPPLRTLSDGLFTGPLVLDGAHIRANATGTAFYAVVNRTLYQTAPATDGLCVTEVAASPAAVTIDLGKIAAAQAAMQQDVAAFNESHHTAAAAKTLAAQWDASTQTLGAQRITISATVKSAATDPPTSVTVDLSRLGHSATSPLYDDGQHGDGAPHDGVYANAFALNFSALRPIPEDTRATWPGPVDLSVSATSKQSLAGAVGVLALYSRQNSVAFPTLAAPVRTRGAVAGTMSIVRGGTFTKIVSVKAPGDWEVAMRYGQETVDLTGQMVLSFWIRSSQISDNELSLRMADLPTYSRPTETKPIKLLAEGFIPGGKFTPADVHVVIPISRLLADAGDFQSALAATLLLSGTADQPVDLMIHDVRFFPTTQASTTPDAKDAN